MGNCRRGNPRLLLESGGFRFRNSVTFGSALLQTLEVCGIFITGTVIARSKHRSAPMDAADSAPADWSALRARAGLIYGSWYKSARSSATVRPFIISLRDWNAY